MIENDTIELLRECDAGTKMAISSIDDVLQFVKSNELLDILNKSKRDHEKVFSEIGDLLADYRDNGKNPNPIAKGMSWMKTNVKITVNNSDNTVANLITDGCNMGVKSLNKYLNQYKAADEKSKNLTEKLIKLEESLSDDMTEYL